jgi:hypothetical protein
MRYELDIDGYILHIYFGCYSDTGNCQEYTGEVPTGYNNLIEWSEKALINAYYINSEGNLTLDTERESELKEKIAQDTIDNAPVLHKEIFESNQTMQSQYRKETKTSDFLVLNKVKNFAPKVKITNITSPKLSIYTQSYNMLKNDAKTETINGIDFTRLADGSIKINGTATADIEYNLSGSSTNTTPIFVLKKNKIYKVNVVYDFEMRYFDGETTSQVYVGSSGTLIPIETKKVTQVLLKIPSGTVANTTIVPSINMLGMNTTGEYKSKILDIDLTEYLDLIYPSNTTYPSNMLYPRGNNIDYVLIEDGIIYMSKNNYEYVIGTGNVQLFNGENIVYADQDATIELEYYLDILDVEMYNGLMSIDRKGLHFFESTGTEIGDIGVIEDEGQKHVAFAIDGIDGKSVMSWGVKYNGKFIPVFNYSGNNKTEGTEAGGVFCFEAPVELLNKPLCLDTVDGTQIMGDSLGNVNINNVDSGFYINDGSGNVIFALDALTGYVYAKEFCSSEANSAKAVFSNTAKTLYANYSSDYIVVSDSFESNNTVVINSTSSDRRLKKNIKDTVKNALDTIKQIIHKQFTWKSNNKHVDIGYIAQELEEIDPNLIHKREKTDKDGNIIDYDYQVNTLQMVALCTKAIQEQQKQIDFLINKLNCKEELENYMKGEN